eukprot:308946-Pelagomonas_calceolata.AAC.8
MLLLWCTSRPATQSPLTFGFGPLLGGGALAVKGPICQPQSSEAARVRESQHKDGADVGCESLRSERVTKAGKQ